MIDMDTLENTTPATDPKAVPYVGMRPFECEEHDWFYGRDADAQFLVDKVLSARLTLLYAPSGVGKVIAAAGPRHPIAGRRGLSRALLRRLGRRRA